MVAGMTHRQITSHHTNAVNALIRIHADEPTHGNASHVYSVEWFEADEREAGATLRFQNGPIGEVGVNGMTNEVLLAIVVDRLRGFQSGPYACRENELALTRIEEAAMWLESRTKQRTARGVEGTHTV